MRRLALFLSGSGTNAENIITYFKSSNDIEVVLVLSDRVQAFGLERSRRHGVETIAFSRHDFLKTDIILRALQEYSVDFIVLAGFLCYVPENIVSYYAGRIVNIHPSLLPKHGGKGMYGASVHKAVIASGDTVSGITIHHINDKFDEGEIIFQSQCVVLPTDTAEDVEKKVRALEILHFPSVIEKELMKSILGAASNSGLE